MLYVLQKKTRLIHNLKKRVFFNLYFFLNGIITKIKLFLAPHFKMHDKCITFSTLYKLS